MGESRPSPARVTSSAALAADMALFPIRSEGSGLGAALDHRTAPRIRAARPGAAASAASEARVPAGAGHPLAEDDHAAAIHEAEAMACTGSIATP